MTRHVSRSSKVIRGDMRSLTSDNLEWPIFSFDRFQGALKCFNLIWHIFTHSGRPYRIPKSRIRRPTASVWPDLWGHWLTWDRKFGYHRLPFVERNMLVSFLQSSNSIRGWTGGGSDGPHPTTLSTLYKAAHGGGLNTVLNSILMTKPNRCYELFTKHFCAHSFVYRRPILKYNAIFFILFGRHYIDYGPRSDFMDSRYIHE